ncbi:MAG: DUF3341 domain-containing protein [Proteobacteria bacterium]|nr:DUF3341 domain-containing protein [Pseudomonadota bacterium]
MSKVHGALAEFANPAELYHACEKVRDAGYNDWDSHSPFPIHGIEKAMGFAWSRVPWFALVFGLTGAAGGFALQVWISTVASPLVISGKPLLSWPAYVPVTFELGIICTAIGTLGGMCLLNRLPAFYHWLFHSKRFESATDDGFFISIESTDSKWDSAGTSAFLESLGASHVELVEG